MLHRSVYGIVTREGIEGLTVRKVSSGCGLSDPYIYQCYEDIPDLLQNAYMEIDEKVANLVAEVIQTKVQKIGSREELLASFWMIWDPYWNFLMEDPERTVFYWRYYQSAYYSVELLKQRQQNYEVFISFFRKVGEAIGISNQINVDVLVSNLIDDTVSQAVKIHLGYYEKENMPEPMVYQSVFAFCYYLIGISTAGAEKIQQNTK